MDKVNPKICIAKLHGAIVLMMLIKGLFLLNELYEMLKKSL
jgi:hypothetical protein